MNEIAHSKQTVLKIMPRKVVRRRKGWTPDRKLYVIHFESPLIIYKRPYFSPYGGPYHYVGITYNIEKRFQAHLGG